MAHTRRRHPAAPRHPLETGEPGLRALGIVCWRLGANRLPFAVAGAPGGGAVTINNQYSFHLELNGGTTGQQKARRRLLEELAAPSPLPLSPAVVARGAEEFA